MNNSFFTESDLESAVIEWFTGLGYFIENGPAIAPEEPAAEREDYSQGVLM